MSGGAAAASAWIRERAGALGFDACGVARVPGGAGDGSFPEGRRFLDWLDRGHGGDMAYLRRSAAARADPDRVIPGARSVVMLAKRYPGVAPEPAPGEGRVALYARGRDYHNALLRPLRRLLADVLQRYPGADGRSFVDRGAVLEKAWAARAGLGWIGKNTLLLHPGRGSYTLLAGLFVTLELAPDEAVADHCGACRLCLDACPTAAFPAPYVLDARRCISYLTIEQKGDIPPDLRPAVADHVFGCDVCQEVCPYNRAPLATLDPRFETGRGLHEDLAALLALDAAAFAAHTRGRPLARPGREGLVRNAAVVAGNSGDARWIPALARLLDDASEVVRRHAAWALDRLRGIVAPAP